MSDPAWVASQSSFDAVVSEVAREPRYAIDTEFHRERSYYPRLALLQIAWADQVALVDYVQRLLAATRNDDGLDVGASPRSGLMLLMAAKSVARFAGRDFVTPDDMKTALIPALRHRVVLNPTAELEGTTTDDVLSEVVEQVEVPR